PGWHEEGFTLQRELSSGMTPVLSAAISIPISLLLTDLPLWPDKHPKCQFPGISTKSQNQNNVSFLN
ncbi:MAG: hypothetical protein ACRCXB_31095, partial [Aeromonadaceae bacterium]